MILTPCQDDYITCLNKYQGIPLRLYLPLLGLEIAFVAKFFKIESLVPSLRGIVEDTPTVSVVF